MTMGSEAGGSRCRRCQSCQANIGRSMGFARLASSVPPRPECKTAYDTGSVSAGWRLSPVLSTARKPKEG